MKYLRAVSQVQPEVSRLLERSGVRFSPSARTPTAVGSGTLYPHNNLPVILPEPLAKDLIAAEFTPGRS